MKKQKSCQIGQVTLEPLIAIAVFALVISPFIASLINLVSFQVKNRHIIQATQFAREGLEVTYNLAVNNWDYLGEGTFYPSQSGGLVLGDTPYQINDRFSREVAIAFAQRNATGNIDETNGIVFDPKTLRVASRVFWQEKNKPITIELVTYMINFSQQSN